MKKSLLVLPISIAVLTACQSSNSPAPVERLGENLPPSRIQAVGENANTSWLPQVQGQTAPVFQSNQPVSTVSHNLQNIPQTAPHFVIPRNPATGAPDYSKIVKGSYPAQTYSVRKGDTMYLISYISGLSIEELASLNQLSPPYNLSTGQVLQVKKDILPVVNSNLTQTTQIQAVPTNFEVPRNPVTNAPDYSKIDKGSYRANTYTVRKGDTMYLIAYISGLDVQELAALNQMQEPYRLSVGQVLRVSNNRSLPTSAVVSQPVVQKGTVVVSDVVSKPLPTQINPTPIVNKVLPSVENKPVVTNIHWQWPTQGNIVQGFSNADGGNKGIDIAGSRGQAIYAAAGGRVVYAGNALRGYGNLIIIKHNDDYLSAYAHNESILVKDQQEIRAGQQIAKMGSSGTNSVKLHFEIRYKGKSVDPENYLPKR